MEQNSSAISLLEPGKNVQLELLDENGKKIIYRTSIWSFEDDQLSLLIPSNDKILKSTQPGSKITIVCRSDGDSHDYIFITEFIRVDLEQPLLIINKPSKLEFSIGRNFFRCEVNLPFHWFESKGKCKGEVINLSASGLYAIINPDTNLTPGMVITCQIVVPNILPLIIVAKVMRVVKKENFQGVALNFQFIDQNIQDHIMKYLFQKQRALLNVGQIRVVKS
jgi:c-di-GMP-binding flagellar brake protein YcgR